MENTFKFISRRTKIISERTLENHDLRFCQKTDCRKFIYPITYTGNIMNLPAYRIRKYCTKSCANGYNNHLRPIKHPEKWKKQCQKSSRTMFEKGEIEGIYYKIGNYTFKEYKRGVRTMSKMTLKRLDLVLHDKYIENAWNPNNPDSQQLTINHIIPVRECYNRGFSIEQASNINNLEVITMKENWKKKEIWRKYEEEIKM